MYEISSTSQGMAYDHYSIMLAKYNVHCEPMKDLLHQMHFVMEHAVFGDTIIYAGAGHALHFQKLFELFQHLNLVWHLYDSSNFDPNTLKSAETHASHIQIHRKDFCMEEARKHSADKNLLFICNVKNTKKVVRSQKAVDGEKKAVDGNENENICKDTNVFDVPSPAQSLADQFVQFHQLQRDWVQTMLPKASSLHIKPLYKPPSNEYESFKFFGGRLYTLPFAAHNSAEMKMVVTREDVQKGISQVYSHKQMEEAAAFFNRRIRPHNFDEKCMQMIGKKYADTYQMSHSIALDLKQLLGDFLHISSVQ
jgi:hypothetical protein